jgi:hypothetical protein
MSGNSIKLKPRYDVDDDELMRMEINNTHKIQEFNFFLITIHEICAVQPDRQPVKGPNELPQFMKIRKGR